MLIKNKNNRYSILPITLIQINKLNFFFQILLPEHALQLK